MKPHLPVLLRKALFACFAFSFTCSASSAADLSLGVDDTLTIDYADADSILDLAGGSLQLAGDTVLVLSNCGEGDGKTYTLVTGVGSLLDTAGNAIALDATNNAVAHYFDINQPGTGFWADALLMLAADGSLQLVRHDQPVSTMAPITSRQTGGANYQYGAAVSFENIQYEPSSYAYGGAIFGNSSITLSNNGSVNFIGNTASSSTQACGGAIFGNSSSTITLRGNGSVSFSGNTASTTVSYSPASGGAIYGYSITLSDNGSVSFSGNTASTTGSSSSPASGGAIDGNSSITLSNNGSVSFIGNTASTTGSSSSASGGAIDGDDGTITLSGNGSVSFIGNTASSTGGSRSAVARGGAVDGAGGTITLSGNGSVSFIGNTASTTGSSSSASGGAIYGASDSTITLSGNGSVSFSGNTASTTGSSFSARGGAIFGSDSTITLSGNGSVSFSGNMASTTDIYSDAYGGAITMHPGVFSIQNNTYAVFENNYTISSNALRLQSIYAFDLDQDGGELNVDFSVPKGGKLEFRDSIYINVGSNSASAFHLNDWYENDAGVKVVQTGDIIFTGADATAEYLGNILVKHGLTATDEQMSGYIAESRRSEINGVAQLHDGRLIIRDGAVWAADGISVLASASGESTPTLWLHHGELTRRYSLSGNNALTFAGGTAFELSGQNKVSYSNITLASGSSLVITLDATHATTAALTLASSTLQLPTSGAVTLKLQASANLEQGQSYALLSGLSKPTGWDSSSITVTSGTSGWDVDWNDLSWVDDTLWLYYDTRPDLVTATWTNEEDDGLWNMSSLNWEQNDINYEYKDDVDVVFGDEGAGTVTLVGTITPKSVLVDSAEDYIWNADANAGGKLTGAMALTKQGEGSLTINTENDYTGGTTIEAGSIVVESATALGLGMVLLNGGTLEIANGNFANELKTEGNSAIIVQSGTTWYMSSVFTNSGTLSITGTLDVSGVGVLTDHGVTYTKGNGNGFKTSSAYSIQLVDNSGTINSTATIKHGDIELILGQNGMATAEGTTDFTTYYITAGHEATVNTIRGESGGALSLVDMVGGTLNVNEDAVVKVSGGNVNQTSGVLSGSISDAMLSISGGTLTATLGGTNTLSGDNKLFNVLDNDGTLNISGTLDVTGVGALTDHGVTYTKGNGNGFKTSSAYSIQLVDNSGTINSTATIKHGDIELTLGQNGMATAEGTTDFTTYYITAGHEASVNTIRGESGGALSLIDMTGGTLKVNEDAAVKVSGGNVNQTSGVLSGSISGAMLSISGGTLTATLEGTNTLSGDNKLFNVLDNDGTLNISGTLDVTGVGALTDHGVTYTKGGSNGFKTSSAYSIQLVDNSGTINSTATIKHGDIELILGQNGMATAEGTTDFTTYYITEGHEATVNTIRGESGGALSLIDMSGGSLKVNEDAVVKVTGGSINQTSGVLSGSISDAMLSISGGTLIATLEGTNTLSGDNKLFNVLDNDGTLNISGKIDVSALQLLSDAEGRVGLNGQAVLMSESGFAKAVSYRVTVIDNAGTLVGYEHVEIVHNGTSETLTLQGNGEATGGGTIDYTHLYVENDDHFVISEVEATTGVNLSMVTMDSGVLEVDQSVAVDATGGHISITKDAVLSGAVTDAAVSTAGGTYISEISAQLKGDTTLVVTGGTITVSGDNSYTGGTTVNGGTLVAGYDKAFGTGDVEVNNATLDLKQFSVANKVVMSGNSTLGHAEGASHIVLRSDSQVNFREGYTLGSGKVLEVAGDSTYRGALTLAGGTLALSGKLTVQGDVEFAAGATTTIDVSGWTGLNDGDVLADLGSASHGYVDGCLTLNGIIGDWTLKFDDATGVLTLQTVKEETFSPDLPRNQQVVYDTIKKIMGKGKPDGLLGVLGKDVVSTRDEKALKKLLQAMSGEEYTTMMSSQIEGNQARMRRLRSAAGSAHPQVSQYGIGLYVNAFNNDADVDSDASGPGYNRMEWGANVGVEARIEQNTILGMGLEKSRARVTPNGASRYHEEATRLDAYMVHETGSWRMMGAVGMGQHKYDLSRTLPNGDKTEAESMNGSSVNVMAELAYTLNLAEQHVLQPFFVLESSYNKIDAFEEEGAGSASLRGDSRRAWATDVTLGMRYTYSFAAVSGAPAASLTLHSGVVLSVGDTTDELNLRFAGAEDERFTLNGANRNRWGYNVGVFVSLPLNETTSVFGSAESLLRGDTTQYDAQIGVRVAF